MLADGDSDDLLDRVAALLQSEPEEVVRRAHAVSHGGRHPSPVLVDHWLALYREQGELPEWLARFCRSVEQRHAGGWPSAVDLPSPAPRNPAAMVLRGVVWVLLVCAAGLAVLFIAQYGADNSGLEACLLPPCPRW